VHLARRLHDHEWKYCYKSSWPYAARPHEGEILDKLQGIQGVVRVLAWDRTVVDGDVDADRMKEEFVYHEKPKSGRKQKCRTSETDREGLSPLVNTDDSHFVSGDSEEDIDATPVSFHPRQHWQIVTTYFPSSLSSTLGNFSTKPSTSSPSPAMSIVTSHSPMSGSPPTATPSRATLK
jgi:Fungal protein kinase